MYCTRYKVYMELLFQSDYCVGFYKLLEDEDYSQPCCMIICSRKANLASILWSELQTNCPRTLLYYAVFWLLFLNIAKRF